MTAPTTATRVFAAIEELQAAQGQVLGAGDWLEITQERIDGFAEVTEDHQWIHVDPARAAAGPYGATVAHGYLTLSLIPRLAKGIFRIDGMAMAINYGANRIRFPQPVTAGSRIRAVASLVSVEPATSGHQVVIRYTVEINGRDKPACVAETVRVLVPSAS
jgi:acyl dehydratase